MKFEYKDTSLYLGDCLSVLDTLAESSIDTVITDPPYNLTQKNLTGRPNCLRNILFNVVLPNNDQLKAEIVDDANLSVLTNQISPLDAMGGSIGVEPGVCMPKSPVDLDDSLVGIDHKVKTTGVPPKFISDGNLSSKPDLDSEKFFGDYILDLADSSDSSFCNGSCSCYGELSPGCFTMSIFVPLSSELGCFLRSHEPTSPSCVSDNVGLDDNSFSETQSPSGVLALGGTKNIVMFRFDLSTSSGELRFADWACYNGTFNTNFSCSEFVRTGPRTSGLPTEFQSFRIRLVGFSTNGTFSLYIHKNIIHRLKKRVGGGFMNKDWDKRGIAFDPETWKKVLRVAKPGAFLLAFGGTRTFHRIACAVEDAGWEIRDCCMWLYGCISEDTEVLTDKGWVRYHKNIEDDLVLTVNIESNEFCFDKPLRSFVYENTHPAYRISSDHTDQIVSRNHRCVVERGGRNVFAYAETLKHQESVPFLESLHDLPEVISSTQQCTSHKKQVLLDAVRSQEAPKKETDASAHRHDRNNLRCLQKEGMESQMLGKENSTSNLFMRLQRYFAGEGFSKASSWWREIRSVLLDAEIKRRSCKENDGTNKSRLERRGDLFSQAWELSTNKIRALSKELFEYVSQGWLCNGTPVASGSAHWKMPYSDRSGPSYRPRFHKQDIKSDAVSFQPSTQNIRRTAAKIKKVEYVGKMWCIETRAGAFVARRNGKIFITGNSGFPKSLDISKQLDKKAGVKREVVGVKKNTYDGANRDPSKHGNPADQSNIGKWGLNQTPHGMPLTAPATEEARQWDDWGTALKPAWEPILVAMKPLDGTFAQNAIKHGVSGLHIGASRIEYKDKSDRDSATPQGKCTSKEISAIGAEPDAGRDLERIEFDRPAQTGRWPSNVLLSHHEDCKFVGHRKIRNRSGSVSGNEPSHTGDDNTTCYGEYSRIPFQKHGDDDGFESMEHWKCHPECPVRLLDEQSGTVSFGKRSGGYNYSGKQYDVKGFVGKCKPKAPSNYGDLGGASRFFYVSKVSKKERNAGLPQDLLNTHPTVKPIKLMEYLCTLTGTPTKGTVLDPFMGSGSTGIACVRTGRPFIGIELEDESFNVSRFRIKHAYNESRKSKSRDLFGDDHD